MIRRETFPWSAVLNRWGFEPLMGRLSDWGEASWAKTARAVASKIADDQIPGRAAQMSFYFFLSVFPMLLILMAALGLFLDAQWLVRDAILERLASVAPSSIVGIFTRLLDHLAGQSGGALTWGILVALWAASSGMVATIRGLNKVYAVAEERPWWKRRLVGLALTLVLMLLTAAAMLLLAYGAPLGEAFAQRMGFGSAFVLAWQIGQWPVIFGFVLTAFDLLYHFAPNRPRAHWRWLRPGTLIGIALWLAASLALKFYVTNVGQYNVAYGSLGAVIVLLLWFYLTDIAILAGAEINAELENTKTGSGMEVKSLLVWQSADPAVQEEIRRFLTGREEISGRAERDHAAARRRCRRGRQGAHGGKRFGDRDGRGDQ
ncbi:MAG: YihY/virulence factor BrkB family protein, partial [Steroidobacter sp.]